MAWPPGYPKSVSTPSASRLAMMAWAPVMVLPSCSVWLPGPKGLPLMASSLSASRSARVVPAEGAACAAVTQTCWRISSGMSGVRGLPASGAGAVAPARAASPPTWPEAPPGSGATMLPVWSRRLWSFAFVMTDTPPYLRWSRALHTGSARRWCTWARAAATRHGGGQAPPRPPATRASPPRCRCR